MTGGSAAMFCNVHSVYPIEFYLTVDQEANWEITLFVRPHNVVRKNGLAFRSMKSSSGFLRKSHSTILAYGNERDSAILAMPLDYDKVTFWLGLLSLPMGSTGFTFLLVSFVLWYAMCEFLLRSTGQICTSDTIFCSWIYTCSCCCLTSTPEITCFIFQCTNCYLSCTNNNLKVWI